MLKFVMSKKLVITIIILILVIFGTLSTMKKNISNLSKSKRDSSIDKLGSIITKGNLDTTKQHSDSKAKDKKLKMDSDQRPSSLSKDVPSDIYDIENNFDQEGDFSSDISDVDEPLEISYPLRGLNPEKVEEVKRVNASNMLKVKNVNNKNLYYKNLRLKNRLKKDAKENKAKENALDLKNVSGETVKVE